MTSTRRLTFVIAIGLIVVAAASAYVTRDRLRAWWTKQAATGSPQPGGGMAAPASPADATPRVDVPLDLRRQQLIGVRTIAVAHESLPASIRTVGVVRAAETRLTDVNVRIDGWIRDLRADFTGQPVTKGQPLFTLYSPDLAAAEREFVIALKGRDEVRQSILPEAAQRAESLITAGRQRLQLLGVPSEQIADLERTREPQDTMTFTAPVSGFVLEKSAIAGMHVTPGQTLYRLADLDVVWIEADAYEHDLPNLRIGAVGTVTLDAYPTDRLTAKVIFIPPSLQADTRTAKVRFEVSNPRRHLRPGMYANVEIATQAASTLVVPADAVLDSGREQVVFVADGNGTFTPRRVQVGARRQNLTEILSGLKEGEQIATSAAFFLDSESQLRAGTGSYESTAPAGANAPASSSQLAIALRTQPDPPKTGENTFEVSVKDAAGQPIADAEVSLQFFMPAMPTMNMPAMRNTIPLASAGGGLYRGTGEVMMAGRWEVTVAVSRRGQRLGSLQTPLVAR